VSPFNKIFLRNLLKITVVKTPKFSKSNFFKLVTTIGAMKFSIVTSSMTTTSTRMYPEILFYYLNSCACSHHAECHYAECRGSNSCYQFEKVTLRKFACFNNPALPADIRLGCKRLQGTNALAYFQKA
jgi:hypothetical protein